MKKLWVVFTLILVFTAVTACSSKDSVLKQPGQTADTSVKAPSYTNIKPEDAKKSLENEQGIILLDVRTVEEYTEKHIPGSILIPVDDIEKKASELLTNKDAKIFVYCRSGNRSGTASKALVKMGFTNIYNLGGIINWPYETEAGAPNK